MNTSLIIDREARERIRLVASVRPSVCQRSHDTWNTVQDHCVFVCQYSRNVRDQELRAAVGGFFNINFGKYYIVVPKYSMHFPNSASSANDCTTGQTSFPLSPNLVRASLLITIPPPPLW